MKANLRCKRLRLPTLTLALLTSASAHALQVVDARDGVTVEASISVKEPTRIRLEQGSVTDVFGNIYSSSCGQAPVAVPPGQPGAPNASGINPLGEIVLECDRDKGEIYVRPVGNGTKPINLFVSSGQSTFTLLLKRADMPADTIVIRDKTPRKVMAADGQIPASLSGRSPVHIRALKTMLIAMATDRVATDIRVEEVGRPIQLWAEAKFSLMRTYEGRGLIGEKYLLTNISAAPMVLAEQEFDREDADIRAIAVENQSLAPGDSTNVYVIRGGN
jgi:conjugal transfer pilus assembly protein TraK